MEGVYREAAAQSRELLELAELGEGGAGVPPEATNQTIVS
jgi:hypothetical protein